MTLVVLKIHRQGIPNCSRRFAGRPDAGLTNDPSAPGAGGRVEHDNLVERRPVVDNLTILGAFFWASDADPQELTEATEERMVYRPMK
jgi:hypothetical protein